MFLYIKLKRISLKCPHLIVIIFPLLYVSLNAVICPNTQFLVQLYRKQFFPIYSECTCTFKT